MANGDNPFYAFPLEQQQLAVLLGNGNLFDVIKKLFRTYSLEFHPDRLNDFYKNKGLGEHDIFAALSDAYDDIKKAKDTDPAQLREWVENYGADGGEALFMGAYTEEQIEGILAAAEETIDGHESRIAELEQQVMDALDGKMPVVDRTRIANLEKDLAAVQSIVASAESRARDYESKWTRATQRADGYKTERDACDKQRADAEAKLRKEQETTSSLRKSRTQAREQAIAHQARAEQFARDIGTLTQSLTAATTAESKTREALKRTRETAERNRATYESTIEAAEQMVQAQAAQIIQARNERLLRSPVGALIQSIRKHHETNGSVDTALLEILHPTAKEWASEGLLGTAVELYGFILDIAPDHPRVWHDYTHTLSKLGRTGDALSFVKNRIAEKGLSSSLVHTYLELSLKAYYGDLLVDAFKSYNRRQMARTLHKVYDAASSLEEAQEESLAALREHGEIKSRAAVARLSELLVKDVFASGYSSFRIYQALHGELSDTVDRGFSKVSRSQLVKEVKQAFYAGGSPEEVSVRLAERLESIDGAKVQDSIAIGQLAGQLVRREHKPFKYATYK